MRRTPILLLLAALAAACSSPAQRAEPEPVASHGRPGDAPADHAKPENTAAAATRSNDVSPDKALEQARTKLADAFEVGVDDIHIERLEPAELAGVLVFRGYLESAGGTRGSWSVVAVDTGGAHLGPAATQAVLRRWAHGDLDAVAPRELARVLGFLESTIESTTPVLTQEDMDSIRADWRAHVFLPRRSTIDGLVALEYWVRSGEPPLWLSQVLIREDGSFERRTKEIWDFR